MVLKIKFISLTTYLFAVLIVKCDFIFVKLATGGDANAVALTEAYDWYILPVMNPDGYAYTWSSVRLCIL